MGNRSSSSKKTRGYSKRRVAIKEEKQYFLIVCEGTKTEPNYFKSFPVPKNVVISVFGTAKNTIGVVEEAIELKENDDYDQVWCVFDRDSFPKQNFNQAIEKAKRENIKVAYSNEAFEIWYLLHFDYRDTKMSRTDYKKALTNKMRQAKLLDSKGKYEKNDSGMYRKLKNRQTSAIKNAERLLDGYHPANPEKDNPSTTVHLLVEQLNRFVSQ